MDTLIFDFDLPFEEAIAWAEDRVSVLPADYYGVFQAAARARAFTVSGLTAINQIQDALDGLNKVLQDGLTFEQWRKTIVQDPQMLALGKARLETIFRTNIQTNYSVGRTQQQRENVANRPFLMYDAINDARTRPNHMALDNFIAPISDPIWSKITPPNGFNCLLPDTSVSGDFDVGLKSFYSGPAVEIVTESGKRLSVTTNHPILTSRGFVAAHQLINGDQLLSNRQVIKPEFGGVIDNDKSPSSVQDVFDALSFDAFGVVNVSALDLHGDARFCQSNVHVAGSNSVLMDGFCPKEREPQHDWSFVWGRAARAFSCGLHSVCAPVANVAYKIILFKDAFYVWNGSSYSARNRASAAEGRVVHGNNHTLQGFIPFIGGFPCSSALTLNESGALLNFLPFQEFCSRPSTRDDARLKQNAPYHRSGNTVLFSYSFFTHASRVVSKQFSKILRLPAHAFNFSSAHKSAFLLHRAALNPGIAQETIKKAAADTVLFQQLAMRHASDVVVDNVLSVRNFTFSGHVYDFQTKQGWMFANGIIVSNCRCTVISLTEAQARKRGWKGFTEYRANSEPDNGWDYNPADSQDARLDKIMADRLAKANPALKQAYDRRMRSEQIAIYFGDLTEPNITPAERAARDYVVSEGKRTTTEHCVALRVDGTEISRVASRNKNSVNVPRFPNEQPGSVTLIHNHPNGSSLSRDDLVMLLERQEVASVAAAGHNGFYAKAEKLQYFASHAEAKRLIQSVYAEALSVSLRAVKNRVTNQNTVDAGLLIVVVGEILAKRGIISYTVNSNALIEFVRKVMQP